MTRKTKINMTAWGSLGAAGIGGILLLGAAVFAQSPSVPTVPSTSRNAASVPSPLTAPKMAPVAGAASKPAPAAARPTAKVPAKSAPGAAPAKASAPAAPAKSTSGGVLKGTGDVVIRNAKTGTTVYDEIKGVARITKDVRVSQVGEDFILYCQQLTYNEKTNQAVATGEVRIESRDSTITGLTLRADFNSKIVNVLGRVVMNSHGKGDGIQTSNSFATRRNKPSRMTCDRVDYSYENREATITGNILITQEDTSGTCERIEFDEENNVVELLGNARFKNKQGQTLQSPRIKIWLDQSRVLTEKTVMTLPRQSVDNATPRPTKRPPGTAPEIPEEWLNDLGRTPGAAPTPRPEADEPDAPDATPTAAPDEN